MAVNYFRVFFSIVVLTIISQRVSCLSCYTCTSNVSWEDCNSKMTKTGCPSGTTNCAQSLETCTTAGGVKKQIFYKRCGTQGKDCQPKNSPSSCIGSTIPIFGFSSEDMCCSGNNCNSGPVRSAAHLWEFSFYWFSGAFILALHFNQY